MSKGQRLYRDYIYRQLSIRCTDTHNPKPKVCCKKKRGLSADAPYIMFWWGTNVFWWEKRRRQKKYSQLMKLSLLSHFTNIWLGSAANIEAAAHRNLKFSKVQNSKCRRLSFSCRRLVAACSAVRGQRRLWNQRFLSFHIFIFIFPYSYFSHFILTFLSFHIHIFIILYFYFYYFKFQFLSLQRLWNQRFLHIIAHLLDYLIIWNKDFLNGWGSTKRKKSICF